MARNIEIVDSLPEIWPFDTEVPSGSELQVPAKMLPQVITIEGGTEPYSCLGAVHTGRERLEQCIACHLKAERKTEYGLADALHRLVVDRVQIQEPVRFWFFRRKRSLERFLPFVAPQGMSEAVRR